MAIVTKSGKIALSMVQAGDSQNFWMLPNDYSASIPAGLYITKQSIDSFKASPSDSNIFMNSSSGIFIRNGLYNQIVLQAGTTNPSLRLYAPGGTGSEGELSVELIGGTNPVLNLYKVQGTTKTIAAILDTQGLILKDGGVIGGTAGTTDFIYLSTYDYSGSPAITINGNSADWRLIAGKAFGVTEAGALYASNANIDGTIVAKSGRIGAASDGTGGWIITTDKLYNDTLGSDGSMYLATQNIDVGQNPPMIGGHTITSAQTETEGWRLTVGSGFGVTDKGTLYANGVDINGKFSATSLSTNGRTGSTTGTAGTYIASDGAIYVGSTNAFRVTSDGKLYATSAEISGNVTIGGDVSMGSEGSVTQLWQAARKVLDFIRVATIDSRTGIKIANNVSQSTSYAFVSDYGMKIYQNSNKVADFGANFINFYSSGGKSIYSVSVLNSSSDPIYEDFNYSTIIDRGKSASVSKTFAYPVSSIYKVRIDTWYTLIELTPSQTSKTVYVDSSHYINAGYTISSTSGSTTITVVIGTGALGMPTGSLLVYSVCCYYYTNVSNVSQVALGTNPLTPEKYLLAVGNGYGTTPSNAMTLDFYGNLEVYGGISAKLLDGAQNKRYFRPVLIGTSDPSSSDGIIGDVYIKYSD